MCAKVRAAGEYIKKELGEVPKTTREVLQTAGEPLDMPAKNAAFCLLPFCPFSYGLYSSIFANSFTTGFHEKNTAFYPVAAAEPARSPILPARFL